MIIGFKDKRLKRLYGGEDVKEWSDIRRQAEKRLRILDAADRLETLAALPSNRFEALHGNRLGQYSIRVNIRWRLCFAWPSGSVGPTDVEMVDYH
jgi:proteic killer suppression protein